MSFSDQEKREILAAADAIQDILKTLPSPRHAANALSIAQAGFISVVGGDTEAAARKMLSEANSVTMENWAHIKDVKLAS